eukprot:g874.t1
MFHSKNVSKQWDTWVYVENGTYYAYYLVTEVSYGEGFGVGTSTDGVHWVDRGYVWKGPSWWNPGTPSSPEKFWEGSSAIWRAADFNETGRYIINYSQMNTDCGCQNITFAESYDLIHWTNGLEKNESDKFPWFNIDADHYKVKGGRWDTIYSIPVHQGTPGHEDQHLRDGYPRYGYWTASPVDGSNGTFGFGITEDGFTWQALPSPQMLPEAIGAELGAVEYVREKNVWVAMLGYGWPRQMLAYTAPAPTGPFTRNAKNVDFLNGACYYARFFRGVDDELLVTHQTWDNHGTHYSYVSPFKRVDVDDEHTFRLKWWPTNEKIKGDPLPVGGDPSSMGPATANVSQGLVVEASFVVPSASDPIEAWPGFLLETKVPGATFVGMDQNGVGCVGAYKTTARSHDLNWTVAAAAAGTPQPVPTAASDATDWELADGASAAPGKTGGGGGGGGGGATTDIRSGGPGQTTLALVAHPLWSDGHVVTGATVSFQYVAGYGCMPGACSDAPNVSLALVDAFNHTIIRTLWTSDALDKYSYDKFTGYSPPVTGAAAPGLSVGWPRQMQLALVMHNNQHNLQIPSATVKMAFTWGSASLPPGTGPWAPTSLTTLQVQQRWPRDLAFAPGSTVTARLLYRRSMLEMYLNDYLFPVYAMPDATGRFSVSNASVVLGTKAWRMSLPADGNDG